MSVTLAIQDLPDVTPLATTESSHAASESGFSKALAKVNEVLKEADRMASGYATGEVGLTDAVLAATRADVTFSLAMALRNRALAAYQEIMNMQV